VKSNKVAAINNNNKHTRLFVSGALFLSLLFAGWSATWGFSEVLTLNPRYLMSSWEKDGKINDEKNWQTALESLELANSINSSNPEIIFDMARLFEWRALQKPIWTEHAHQHRSEAIKKYRQTVENRPTWALAWASLAQNKFLNQEMDQEMWEALRNASTYGPWEAAVQRKLIWLGIATWKYIPSDLRDTIQTVIIASLRNRNLLDFILSTAVRYRWEENLLPYIDEYQTQRLQWFVRNRG